MISFNPEEPNNTLPLLPPNLNFKDTDILLMTIEVAKSVSQLRTRLTMSKRSVANTLDLLSPLFVPEAVASSGVENIITTNESVYSAKLRQDRDLSPAEKETMRYTEALALGARILGEKGFLATNDYIAIQSALEPNRQGVRNLPVQLKNPETGKIYYTPPVGKNLLLNKLGNLEKYYNEPAPISEIYARMAVIHYQIEAIHPFLDGNGRAGRILMPLYLTLQGELPVPVLFISQYILKNKDDYYRKLRIVTEKGNWKPWVLYILKATKEQADYTTGVLDKIQANLSKVKSLLKEKYKKMYSSELVDFLFSRAFFTEKEFERDLGISFPTARKYLAVLENEKIIKKGRQAGRNRFLYVNLHYTDILLNA